MWKNLIVLFVCLVITNFVLAQTPPPDKPVMQKQAPVNNNPPLMAQPAPKSIQSASKEKATSAMSSTMKKAFAKQKTASRGTTILYPPYMNGWVQKWTDGTGYIPFAESQKDQYGRPTGFTFQGGSSYAYGMASSRCWVSCVYVPSQTGNYEIIVDCYQEGALRAACGYSNSEVYAYRTLGIMVEGIGYEARVLSELYFDRPISEQNKRIQEWQSARKTFYLQAGKSYNICAYSEVGGWSAGDSQTYQITNITSAIGPFTIQLK